MFCVNANARRRMPWWAFLTKAFDNHVVRVFIYCGAGD